MMEENLMKTNQESIPPVLQPFERRLADWRKEGLHGLDRLGDIRSLADALPPATSQRLEEAWVKWSSEWLARKPRQS